MPNPGGPYGGCNECRRRKVKCDQTYPACRRCVDRNAICPGTKETYAQIFRDETVKTTLRARSGQWHENYAAVPSQARASAPAPCCSYRVNAMADIAPTAADFQDNAPGIEQNQHKGYATRLPQLVTPPTEAILTAFFFDQLICPETGWYAYLPRLHQLASANDYLDSSIRAAALFVLANQRPDHPELMSQARMEYSDALSTLNTALGEEDERLRDEVPCAVLILIMIEAGDLPILASRPKKGGLTVEQDITGCRNRSCLAHLSGLQRVLGIRKTLGIKSLFGAEVWHSIAMKMQSLSMSTLHQGSLLDHMLLPDLLVTPALQMHEILVAGRELDKFVTDVLTGDTRIPRDTLYSCLRGAKILDLELGALSCSSGQETAEHRWQRRVMILPDCTLAEYFSSLEAAQYWNQNRCARIHLHRNILKLAAYILQQRRSDLTVQQQCEFEEMMTESRQLITELLNAICHSIPFNLHRMNRSGRAYKSDESQQIFGAAGLVWPLEVVISCEQASGWQRDLARNTLWQIGLEIGVRQALVVLDENE